MAPPKRFELLTPSFVAKYSNPLSYGGIINIYCVVVNLTLKDADSKNFLGFFLD